MVIEVDLGGLDDTDLAVFPDEVDLHSQSPLLTYRLEINALDEDTGEIDVRRYFPNSGHDRSATREQAAAVGWSFIPADRDLARDLGAGRRGVLRRLLADITLTDRELLDEAMSQLRDAFSAQPALRTFRASLTAALASSLTAGPEPTVGVALRGDLEGDLLGSIDFTLQRGRRTPPRLLHEQSDGARALAAMAIYSMAAAERGIVAVDEPEMHLHPAAQRAVGRLLSTMPAQAVIATHSAAVVAEAHPSSVIAFTPTGGPRTLNPNADVVHPAFHARWWTTGLVDVLTCRCAAVVEGPADRIIVERAARAHDVDFGRQGISVLDLEGADKFKHAYKVLGADGFDIAFRALGDEDTRNDWAACIGEPVPANLEAHGFALCDVDLEDEYVRALGHRRVLLLLARTGFVTLSQIRSVGGKASLRMLTPEDVRRICRRYKADAAASIALLGEDAEIRNISSVARFIRMLNT